MSDVLDVFHLVCVSLFFVFLVAVFFSLLAVLFEGVV